MDDNLLRLVREIIERPESPTALAIQASLERPLSQTEWGTLEGHAHRNYRDVMKPGMAKHLPNN